MILVTSPHIEYERHLDPDARRCRDVAVRYVEDGHQGYELNGIADEMAQAGLVQDRGVGCVAVFDAVQSGLLTVEFGNRVALGPIKLQNIA